MSRKIPRKERNKAFEYLRERYPNVFRKKGDKKPLEIGIIHQIKADLLAEAPPGICYKAVRKAITFYTTYSDEYCQARRTLGTPRINLQGEAVSEITEEDLKREEEIKEEIRRQEELKEKLKAQRLEEEKRKREEKAARKAAKAARKAA